MARALAELSLRKLHDAERSLEELTHHWDSFRDSETMSYIPDVDLDALTVTYVARLSSPPPMS